MTTAGTMWGIGVGPGDPELITVKALRLIHACPVLAYPAPETGDSLARSIIASFVEGTPVEVPIRMPMEEARFPAQAVYDQAAETLSGHLDAGRDVAVLCQGDPFFYGSFMYLFERMAKRYRVEIVPGVSSLTAGAAALGAPLVSRNELLTVVPGPSAEDVIRERLASSETVVFLKLGRHFEKVRRVIAEMGLLDRALYIERATMENQRILPIAEVAADAVPYFALIVIRRGELA